MGSGSLAGGSADFRAFRLLPAFPGLLQRWGRGRGRGGDPAARRHRHDLGTSCHLYLKRAKADQIAFGTAGLHRARLAALIDLPAPR
ncbi:hypothetical protein [Nocardioides sp. AN3]